MRLFLTIFCLIFFSLADISAADIYEGKLETFYIDSETAPEKIHRLRLEDGSLRRIKVAKDFRYRQGSFLKLRARDINGELVVDEVLPDTEPFQLIGSQGDSNGEKKVLVVLVTDSSYAESFIPYTSEEIADIFFGHDSSVADYYEEASSSKLDLSGDIIGTLSVPSLCSSDNLFERDVEQTIINTVGVFISDLTVYDFISIVVPDRDECLANASGIGTLGRGTYPSSHGQLWLGINFIRSYNRDSFDDAFLSVAIHELGHNLGVSHANANSCGTEVFSSEACPGLEYGDGHSVMGTSPNIGHFNMIHKQDLGWVGANEILTIDEASLNEDITLLPVSSPSSGTKMIRVKRSDGRYYSVEYRQAIGYDAFRERDFGSLNFDGFLVYLDEEDIGNRPIMIDSEFEDFRSGATLKSSGDYNFYVDFTVTSLMHDRGLFSLGETFNDPVSDISISASSLGSTATITVNKGSVDEPPDDDPVDEDNDLNAYFLDKSTFSSDIVLNFNRKTKIILVVPGDSDKAKNTIHSAKKPSSFRKLVKVKKNKFNLFNGATVKVVVASEKKFIKQGIQTDSEGYYNISFSIVEKATGQITPVVLKLKSTQF